jgi:molybdopterin molybdotransferase
LKKNFISFKESIKKIESLTLKSPTFEKVPLMNARGRTLFEDIIAHENNPKYPTSSLDGFAIKAINQTLPFIKILGDNPAGNDTIDIVQNQTAIKTFTGSVMPQGADTLIQIENVQIQQDKLFIKEPVSIGNGIRPIGEIYKTGDTLIKKGTVIDFAEIGVLAGLNLSYVKVTAKPKIAIFSTGNELLELGEIQSRNSQIRSSNNYTLQALAEKHGGIVSQLGTVKDNVKSIIETFQTALNSSVDIIVTTGGVSVGDYDFVKTVIPNLGAKILFHGVKIKPGQHILVAQKEDKIIIALAGFAYSSTVTFILYVVPLIKKMLGQNYKMKMIQATLSQKFYKRSKKTEFTPCNLEIINSEYKVNFHGKKIGTSAILTNMLNSVNLIITDENDNDKEVGEKIEVILL